MEILLEKKHREWIETNLGGTLEYLDILPKIFPLLPQLTDTERLNGRVSVFCGRRPLRSSPDVADTTQSRKNGTTFRYRLRRSTDPAHRLVSMVINPLSYYPGRLMWDDGPDGARIRRPTPNALSCDFHGIHNLSKCQFLLLNCGFGSQIMAAANNLASQYVQPFLQDAVLYLLDGLYPKPQESSIHSQTDVYLKTRQSIDSAVAEGKGVSLSQAVEETKHDYSKGLPQQKTGREIRWGSIHEIASMFVFHRRFLVWAISKKFGHAQEASVEIDAAALAFSHRGHDPDLLSKWKWNIEEQVSLPFKLLTESTNQLQLQFVHVLNALLLKPLFVSASADKECAVKTMMGLGSTPRNLLLVWSRVIFVDTKPWEQRIALAHSNDGANFGRNRWSLRFLNPLCGPEVVRVLGAAAGEHAATAISGLLALFKTLAQSDGEVLPADVRRAYDAAFPKPVNPNHPGPNANPRNHGSVGRTFRSYDELTPAVKMSQMQFYFSLMAREVVVELRTRFAFELFALEGFVAGMGKQQFTREFECMDSEGLRKARITHAHPLATANAVIVKLLGQDLRETLGSQLQGNEDFEDYFGLIARVWSPLGMAETDDFIGIVADRWGDRHDALMDATARVLGGLDGEYSFSLDGISMFPRALSRCNGRFKTLDKACGLAETTQTNAKPMEQWFSAPSKNARGKRCTMKCLNSYMCKNGWAASNEDPLKVPEDVYRAAEEVSLLSGMNDMYKVDAAKRELMRTDEQRENLPAYIKNGGNWRTSYFVGDGRTKKFGLNAQNRDVENQRARLVRTVCSCAASAGTDPSDPSQSKPVQEALSVLANQQVTSAGSPVLQLRQRTEHAALDAARLYPAADAQAAYESNEPEAGDDEDQDDSGKVDEAEARGSPDEEVIPRDDVDHHSDSMDLGAAAIASTEGCKLAERNSGLGLNLGAPATPASADEAVQAIGEAVSSELNANDAKQLETKNASRSGEWGEDVDKNIFSYQFCFDVFNRMEHSLNTWMESDIVFACNDSISAQVTRKFKKRHGGKLEIGDISFTVAPLRDGTAGTNTRYFFIVFDSWAGAFLADIILINRPTGGREAWSKTMKYRRIWTTKEASTRTDSAANSVTGQLGSRTLKKLLKSGIDIYHSGDCTYEGDIRQLIGVVRWYSDAYDSVADLPTDYFLLYPKADTIKVGSHFSEKAPN